MPTQNKILLALLLFFAFLCLLFVWYEPQPRHLPNVLAATHGPPSTAVPHMADGDTAGHPERPHTSPNDTREPSAPSQAPVPDIAIHAVIWNQATDTWVVRHGDVVPAGERETPLIPFRPALARIDYQLADDFKPRTLFAQLALRSPAHHVALTQHRRVDGPAELGDIDGTFAFRIAADAMRPHTAFRWQLFEATNDAEAPETLISEIPWTPLDILETPLALRVVIIPAHTPCAPVPLHINAAMQRELENELYNMLPLSSLHVDWRAPQRFDARNTGDPAAIIADLAALREADRALPDVLYHAILPHRAQRCLSPGYEAGFALWEHERAALGHMRLSYAVAMSRNWRANVVHELGHSLGRPHTFDDDHYTPYNGRQCGRTSGYGYGVRPGPHGALNASSHSQLRDMNSGLIPPTDSLASHPICATFGSAQPTLNDFMSYAPPFWVSAHTFSRIAGILAVLGRWRTPAGSAQVQTHLARHTLVGFAVDDTPAPHYVWMRGMPAHNAHSGDSHHAIINWHAPSTPPLRLSQTTLQTAAGEYAGVAITLPAGTTCADIRAVHILDEGQRREIPLPDCPVN
ncbi:MAG: hypothetical protein GX146_09750 [Myxococcales bacterium]|jgi:hypothetical protein|nr:hypothetical protein [Myxococcales bacterium]